MRFSAALITMNLYFRFHFRFHFHLLFHFHYFFNYVLIGLKLKSTCTYWHLRILMSGADVKCRIAFLFSTRMSGDVAHRTAHYTLPLSHNIVCLLLFIIFGTRLCIA